MAFPHGVSYAEECDQCQHIASLKAEVERLHVANNSFQAFFERTLLTIPR